MTAANHPSGVTLRAERSEESVVFSPVVHPAVVADAGDADMPRTGSARRPYQDPHGLGILRVLVHRNDHR